MPRFFVDQADMAACHALLQSGSRSFFVASLLLPARVKSPATALYAFCRVADDAIDLGHDPQAALADLHARLDAIYAGCPRPCPFDRAFAATITAYAIPRAWPAALLEGLAWDAQSRRYQDLSQLLDYAARVAGSVGVMMALLMGVRTSTGLSRAADLGVAMQLTNIARDVGEDAQAGRLFLPLDWLREAGVDPAALLRTPRCSPGLQTVVARLLREADSLYVRALDGIALLPLDCRPGIAAARRIYAAIGARIAAQNFDALARRARVPGHQKMFLALLGLRDGLKFHSAAPAPALQANVFLLNAAPAELPADPHGLAQLLEIFARLERDQREAAARVTI